MKRLLLLLPLLLPGANLYMRPGDTFAVNVYVKTTGGTVTTIDWKGNSGFSPPAVVKLIAAGALSCKGNNLMCTFSGLSLANWDGPIAQYTFRCPTVPGTYAINTQSVTVHGGTASVDLRSGVTLSVSPKAVTYQNGTFTITDPSANTVVLGFAAPSTVFTVQVQ